MKKENKNFALEDIADIKSQNTKLKNENFFLKKQNGTLKTQLRLTQKNSEEIIELKDRNISDKLKEIIELKAEKEKLEAKPLLKKIFG